MSTETTDNRPGRIRPATPHDRPALLRLVDRAVAALSGPVGPDERVVLRAKARLDEDLLGDGTLLVLEIGDGLSGLGGWGRRAGFHSLEGARPLLDPARDPAPIRSMFTDPDFARRGVASRLLAAAEAAAAEAGFSRAELLATPAGRGLYARRGWHEIGPLILRTPDGAALGCMRMEKALTAEGRINAAA